MTQMTIPAALHLAQQHLLAGQLQSADAICKQILAVQPNHSDTIQLMGMIWLQAGNASAATDWFGRAVRLFPESADCRYNFAMALQLAGQNENAIAEYSKVLVTNPNHVPSLNNLIEAYRLTLQLDRAIETGRKLTALQPRSASAWFNLGNALRDQGELQEAIATYRRSLVIEPANAPAGNNLAETFRRAGDLEQADATITTVLQKNPDFADALLTRGVIRHDQLRLNDSIADFRKVIAKSPSNASAHYNLGITLLLSGQFREGWNEFEWRFQQFGKGLTHHRFSQRRWDGSNPSGKRILLYAEQGFGDTIQFSRYAQMLGQRGATVILAVQPELCRLLRCMPSVERVISMAETLPEFDLHVPLMSMPRVMGTDSIATIPAFAQYLSPDAERSQTWTSRITAFKSPRIGIAWAGKPEHINDRYRSIRLSQLASVLRAIPARFISLQKGEPARQIAEVQNEIDIVDFASELTDFVETAGLIEQLDLVITVDTVIAHLAAAMGKPTFVLLPHIPDWRWLLERGDSPWYPSITLFRQTAPAEWSVPSDALFATVRHRLG